MNNAYKVSVIIPVYNGAKFLDCSVASWTAQTLQDIEIIYVNDASTDTSLEKLNEWGVRDCRIRIFSLPQNKGTLCARKMGIQQARGKYIMFADQDDTVLPETCEELAHAMDEAQVDILQFGTEVITTQKVSTEYVEKFLRPYIDSTLHGRSCLTGCFREDLYTWILWNKIYKSELCKKAFEAIKDQRLPIADDKVIYFIIASEAKTYKGISKKYYQYNIDTGQTGRKQYTLSQFEDFCRMAWSAKCIEDFINDKGLTEQYNDIIQKNRIQLLSHCAYIWSILNNEDKAAGFDMMMRYWHPEEVISRLAEMKFHDTAEMAKLLRGAVSLKYDGHPVKTIAAYYHRISNGGAERVLCQLCWIWQAMGYRVIVLTDKEPCADDYELPAGTERIVIPDFQTITPQSYHKRATVLQHIITDYHIDAVVSHAWEDHLLFWDEVAIKTAGAAFIVHCHGVFSLPMLWDTRYDNHVFSLAIADAVVSLSDTDCTFWKYFNANTHVTNNPLPGDIRTWHPKQFVATHKILWIGRLEPIQKNPIDILPIMQDVIQAVPDAELTIVGKSENGSVEKQMQEQIAKLHLEDHIKLEGFHTDVRPWYLSSQIFVMTSSFEGYPLTLLESKMAGIPCVMYELPYLTLCEGNRGIIPVPQRDTKAAAQAIIKLLQDDALCAQYGHDARAHLEELAQFDFKKKWQQIFESVEHTHAPIVSNTEKLMMETLIAYHGKSLEKETRSLRQELDSRNCEIQQLRHGSYIKRVARAVVPNRAKPFLKAIVRRIPQGIKSPLKRLLRWQ